MLNLDNISRSKLKGFVVNPVKTYKIDRGKNKALDVIGRKGTVTEEHFTDHQPSLKQAYRTFCNLIDLKRDQIIGDDIGQLVLPAWITLAYLLRVYGGRRFGVAGLFVPDLIFARLDHRTPDAFIAELDVATIANWHRATHILSGPKTQIAMSLIQATNYLWGRVETEAYQHRPITELFAEVTDAR